MPTEKMCSCGDWLGRCSCGRWGHVIAGCAAADGGTRWACYRCAAMLLGGTARDQRDEHDYYVRNPDA